MDKHDFEHWKEKGIANVWGVPMTYSFYEDILAHDAMKVIPSITIPILWFHGTADAIVPIQQAYDAKQLNKRIELVEVKDGGHRFSDKMQPGEWETKVESFIHKLLNKI
jgi:pimeloyl-ACP methyl ester carboxylesterase